MEVKDKYGVDIEVGDAIAVAYRVGNVSEINYGHVTEIKIDKNEVAWYSWVFYKQVNKCDPGKIRKICVTNTSTRTINLTAGKFNVAFNEWDGE